MVRKLRQINESLNGYEPEGREFESLRAHHSFQWLTRSSEQSFGSISPTWVQQLSITSPWPVRADGIRDPRRRASRRPLYVLLYARSKQDRFFGNSVLAQHRHPANATFVSSDPAYDSLSKALPHENDPLAFLGHLQVLDAKSTCFADTHCGPFQLMEQHLELAFSQDLYGQ
jgi:hypothetical protein